MSLKIYKRGHVWWVSGSIRGERIRQSTGTAQPDIARQIAAEIERRAWQADLLGPETVITFAAAAKLYLDAGKPERFIFHLIDYWRHTVLKDITPGHIRQAAVTLYPTQSNATRNRHVIVPSQAVINHAAELEYCPRVHVKRFPVETKEKRPASWEWVQAFMAHANPHLGALCCFMFLTGARVGEALAVQWEDVDLQNRRVLIRQTKVGAERWAHLPPPCFEAIANLERNGSVFQYKWPRSVRWQWDKVVARAGIEELIPHCCRHGFATSMLQQGIDPITVAKLGGWKSAQHVFQTYGHAMEDKTLTDRLVGTPVPQPARKALIK